jgi:hypothetical protein
MTKLQPKENENYPCKFKISITKTNQKITKTISSKIRQQFVPCMHSAPRPKSDNKGKPQSQTLKIQQQTITKTKTNKTNNHPNRCKKHHTKILKQRARSSRLLA